MSSRYETCVDLRVAPGASYALVAVATHLAGLVAALAMPHPWWAPALVVIALSALSVIRAWSGPVRLIWDGDGSICLIHRDGRRRHADSLAARYRSADLVVLEVHRGGRSRFLPPVFRWEQPEALRRLNQRLVAGRAVDTPQLDASGV